MIDNIFANARAVAEENGLLGIDRLNRMADSASPEEAFKVLSEVNFGEGVAADASDYERAVEAEAEQPLPVDAVEAQRPREGVQRAREQREHRLVLRQPRFLREMGVVAVLLARLE